MEGTRVPQYVRRDGLFKRTDVRQQAIELRTGCASEVAHLDRVSRDGGGPTTDVHCRDGGLVVPVVNKQRSGAHHGSSGGSATQVWTDVCRQVAVAPAVVVPSTLSLSLSLSFSLVLFRCLS